MRFEQVSEWIVPLRIRLTLWNTAAVLVLVLVSMLAVREGLRSILLGILDEFLQEEMASAATLVERLGDTPEHLAERLDRKAWAHPRRRLFIQMFSAQGELQWASMHTPEEPLEIQSREPILGAATSGHYRVLQRRVQPPGGEAVLLRVGCSTDRARMGLWRYTQVALGVIAVILIVSPAGGYLLAGRVTRPLAQIIQKAAHLHPARLEERLPIRRTRDELDQLSATINSLLDRVGAHLKQSRELTANAAHELRTPLAAIQSSLEVALNADRSTEEYKELLLLLLDECDQLRVLVNQLLVLAESDSGKLCLMREPLRLDELVLKSILMFGPAAEVAGVQLRTAAIQPLEVQADRNRLWQVINNLLDNALKFTPTGGTITLDLEQERRSGAGVLRVRDTGRGIAEEDLPHIFERFYQADKSRQRTSNRCGSGLGLSICQAIVEAHGGRIRVQSKLDRGTIFTVELPDAKSPAAEVNAGSPEGKKG